MSPLRAWMIEDTTLAGLVPGTQQSYARAVRLLSEYYGVRPINSANKRCEATCSTYAGEGWDEVPSPTGIAFGSSTNIRGRTWGLFEEKKIAAPPQKGRLSLALM